jgi:ribosomal protein S18 acetylase RimI-like enzyme
MTARIEIKPIDIDAHSATCLSFREDSFISSFGDARRFYEADGQGHLRYLECLREKSKNNPDSVLHAWHEGKIVGQLEIGFAADEPHIGYVYLYYIAPEYRGRGFAAQLDQHAAVYFKSRSCEKMRLSVSPSNHHAWRFYLRTGWKDAGPRPHHPEVHYMEKGLA